MAYTLTDVGVNFSRGRGAARVSLVISFKELDAWAKRQQVDVPKLMRRSFGRACSGLKKKFGQVIAGAGGVCGVPKFKDFDEFTNELRALGRRNDPMGGILADKKRIVAFKRGGWQIVGWPDGMADVARKFQDGFGGAESEKFFTDPEWRRVWHRAGIREIPRAYVHNPRRVLPEPFGEYVKAHLDEWARGAFYKELARQMQKGASA